MWIIRQPCQLLVSKAHGARHCNEWRAVLGVFGTNLCAEGAGAGEGGAHFFFDIDPSGAREEAVAVVAARPQASERTDTVLISPRVALELSGKR